jgi:valyl-tRNA synthetase
VPLPAPTLALQATPHRGSALITAPWPAADAAIDAAATAQFETLQAVIRAVRNARAEYGVELGRKIAATIR